MHVNMSYSEFDVTPHVESSATVDEHGKVTYAAITLFPFGDLEARVYSGSPEAKPASFIMSVEEAEVLARRLLEAVTDAQKGRYGTIAIDRD
ncbi:MAG: hypothetical protein WCE30_18780 [Mycobacterium sp.]